MKIFTSIAPVVFVFVYMNRPILLIV